MSRGPPPATSRGLRVRNWHRAVVSDELVEGLLLASERTRCGRYLDRCL